MNWLKTVPVLLWLAALTLVGWVLSQLPLTSMLQAVASLSPAQGLAWVAVNLAIILLATQRWKTLTQVLNLSVGFTDLLRVRQAGQAVSFITPGPQFGGEPLQIFCLYQRCQLPIHSALLALGLDRFYELWINFGVLLLAVVLLMASPAAAIGHWLQVLPLLVLLLLALSGFGYVLLTQPARVLGWLNNVTRYWQQHPRLRNIETHWQRLGSDLQHAIAEHKPGLLTAFLLSLLGWGGLIAELWLLLICVGLALDLTGFMVILVAMRLAFLLPLPGGIGSLEAALFWAFAWLSLPTEAALGLIALMRLRDAVVLLAGVWCLRLVQRNCFNR